MLPKARSMTRDQIKKFREAGLDPAFLKPSDGPINILRLNGETAEWIADNVYPGQVSDDVPYSNILALSEETYLLTYNVPKRAAKEEKNS
jgi:hypothetical protein